MIKNLQNDINKIVFFQMEKTQNSVKLFEQKFNQPTNTERTYQMTNEQKICFKKMK